MIFSNKELKGGKKMKLLSKAMAAVAMLVVGSASMGCVLFWADEPKAFGSLID